MNILNKHFLKLRISTLYISLTLSIIIVLSVTKHFLITDELYFQSLSTRFSTDQITELLNFQSKYELLNYVILTLMNLLKYGTITLAIYTLTILLGLKINYSNIFKVVILAEFIFLVPLVLKFIWFYFIQSNYTLEELQFFYPLSALNIFNIGEVSQLWIYPLQLLNLFEVVYWFILALGIHKLIKSDYEKSLKLVLSSYLPAMLLWVVFVMFLTVTFNPAI